MRTKRLRNAVVTSVIAAGLVLSPAAANAVTKNVGGGTWTYGTDMNTWSQYQHKTRDHMAGAKNMSRRVDSARMKPGRLATASVVTTLCCNEAFWGKW